MSNTMRIAFVLALTVLFTNCGLISAAYAITSNSATPEVTVTVVCGEIDEAVLANLEFDDGTYLKDYNYAIQYANDAYNIKLRGSTLPLTTFFNSVAWVNRSDGITLSLDPTDDVRSNPSLFGPAWSLLVTYCGSDSYWANEQVMHWQFDCHANFASTKERWNIEPWRTASNYLEVVLAQCNP